MADTYAASGLTPQVWDSKFFEEYTQESLFRPYMGTGETDIIQVKEDLTKKSGDSVTYALVNRLRNEGVTGSNSLEGNEEDLSSRSFRLYVDKLRHGVRVAEMEEQRSAIPLRNAARAVLKTWAMEKLRNNIIDALGSFTTDGKTYATSSASERNTWLTNNSDRVLFGAAIANASSNVFATALATLDTTNDRFTAAAARQMKRIALAANPKVAPIEVGEAGKRAYVVFVGPRCFRDLQTSLETINKDAMQRGMDNPLITGADLHYDGLVFKLVDDIAVLSGVGASSADVEPVYLCGTQAVGLAWAKRTTSRTEEFDYGDKFGVAIEEIRGVRKLMFGSGSSDTTTPKDNGLVTGFFAAPADA
jgi:N4-gp56 family major capsid protein